jgi:hypothetical protein
MSEAEANDMSGAGVVNKNVSKSESNPFFPFALKRRLCPLMKGDFGLPFKYELCLSHEVCVLFITLIFIDIDVLI